MFNLKIFFSISLFLFFGVNFFFKNYHINKRILRGNNLNPKSKVDHILKETQDYILFSRFSRMWHIE